MSDITCRCPPGCCGHSTLPMYKFYPPTGRPDDAATFDFKHGGAVKVDIGERPDQSYYLKRMQDFALSQQIPEHVKVVNPYVKDIDIIWLEMKNLLDSLQEIYNPDYAPNGGEYIAATKKESLDMTYCLLAEKGDRIMRMFRDLTSKWNQLKG